MWHWTAPPTHQLLQPNNNIYQTPGWLCSMEYSIESKVPLIPLMEYKIDGINQAVSWVDCRLNQAWKWHKNQCIYLLHHLTWKHYSPCRTCIFLSQWCQKSTCKKRNTRKWQINAMQCDHFIQNETVLYTYCVCPFLNDNSWRFQAALWWWLGWRAWCKINLQTIRGILKKKQYDANRPNLEYLYDRCVTRDFDI